MADNTMGLSGTVCPLHIGAGMDILAMPVNSCSFTGKFY